MCPLGTENLGPSCITDWFVADIPASGAIPEKTYLFVVSNPSVFAAVDIDPFHEGTGRRKTIVPDDTQGNQVPPASITTAAGGS